MTEPFAELADIEAFLQVEISTELQLLAAQRALEEVTAAIQNYCDQLLELVAGETITLDSAGGTKIFLPELPVVSVSEVVEDEETLVDGEDYKLGQHGILHRLSSGSNPKRWASGIQIVEVTYSHGYATIPADVASVATRAAARAYQAGLKAADTAGVPGVASKALGDFSVSFTGEQGVEGVMGASAARLLLMSEKDVLDKYRVKRP